MRRKLITTVGISALALSMLVGCGTEPAVEQTETQAETTDNTVKLTIWGAENDQDILNQMVETFKEKYKGEAKFDIAVGACEEAEARETILSDIEGAADVFAFADDQLNALVAAGALEKVEDETVKKSNSEGSVEAASVNDTMYAYPMTADNGYFMFYDKEYFTEEDVKSLDKMLDIAAANGKKVTMDYSSGWYLYSFFAGAGLECYLNDDGVTNTCNWNSTENSPTGLMVAQAMLRIATHPGFANLSDDGFAAGLKDGSVIAGINGVWHATDAQNAWGKNYGAVKLPTYLAGDKEVQMGSFAGYKLVGVNAYSNNVEWAKKLADWVTNEENQMLRFEQRGLGPSNINAANSEEVGKSPAIQALLAQSEFSNLQRIGTNYWDPIADFGGKMAAGNPAGEDLQNLLDTMVEKITALVAN